MPRRVQLVIQAEGDLVRSVQIRGVRLRLAGSERMQVSEQLDTDVGIAM